MRRSLQAACITLVVMVCSSAPALANPAGDYAGSHLARTEKDRAPADSVFSAKNQWISGLIGPDVSNHQGCSIDWTKVAQRRAFAFMKASESNWFVDRCFAYNWQATKALHLLRGAYDFARPHAKSATARAEARWFVSVVRSAGNFHNALPPVLDFEVNDDGLSKSQMRRWIKAWIDEIHKRTKRKTVTIYTGQYFWADNVGAWRPKGALLWGARWGPHPPKVPGWKKVSWWQYTDGSFGPKPHRTAGIDGPGDHDVWLGSKSALKAVSRNP